MLAHFSSSTGLDFSRYELDEPIRYVKNDAINSAVETLTTLSAEPWTLRRIISGMGLGSRNPAVVGSAEEVADDLTSWVEETDVDGFNLSHRDTGEPRGLRRSGRADLAGARRLQAPLSVRHLARELFAGSRLLPSNHPAAEHRRPVAFNR